MNVKRYVTSTLALEEDPEGYPVRLLDYERLKAALADSRASAARAEAEIGRQHAAIRAALLDPSVGSLSAETQLALSDAYRFLPIGARP